MKIFSTKRIMTAAIATAMTIANVSAQTATVVPRPVLDPTPGNIPGPFTGVIVTFPGATDIKFSSKALDFYDPDEKVDKTGIIYFGGDEINQSPNMYKAEIDGDKITFTPNTWNKIWSEKGKYQLMIPAGAISMKVDGMLATNPYYDWKWIVSDFLDPVITPGDGEITEMNSLKLTAPEGYEFSGGYLKLSMYWPTLYNADENGQKSGAAVARFPLVTEEIPGATVLEFGSPRTTYPVGDFKPEVGKEYVLELPQSAVKIKKLATNVVANVPSMQVVWRFVEQQMITTVPLKATLTPQSDACFNVWNMKIEDVETSSVATAESPIVIINPENREFSTAAPRVDQAPEGNCYILDFGSEEETVAALSLPGEYSIKIPAGMFILDAPEMDPRKLGNSMELTITEELVKKPVVIICETTPAEGATVDEVTEIVVAFPEAESVTTTLEDIALTDETTTHKLHADKAAPANKLTFKTEGNKAIVAKGIYSFEIPADAVTVDGEPFGGVKVTFTVSGRNGVEITGVETLSTVYSIDGVLLMREATDEEIRQLSPGIYIIDGAKTQIK